MMFLKEELLELANNKSQSKKYNGNEFIKKQKNKFFKLIKESMDIDLSNESSETSQSDSNNVSSINQQDDSIILQNQSEFTINAYSIDEAYNICQKLVSDNLGKKLSFNINIVNENGKTFIKDDQSLKNIKKTYFDELSQIQDDNEEIEKIEQIAKDSIPSDKNRKKVITKLEIEKLQKAIDSEGQKRHLDAKTISDFQKQLDIYDEDMDISEDETKKLFKIKGLEKGVLRTADIIPQSNVLIYPDMCNQINKNFDTLSKKFEDDWTKSMIDVSKKFVEYNQKNKGNISTPNSHEYSSYFTSYLPEIIGPLSFAHGQKSKNCHFINNSFDELATVMGYKDKNIDFSNDCYISFPSSSSNMLSDSVIFIPSGFSNEKGKFKQINISSKGGKTSYGAFASVAGLLQYIINSSSLESGEYMASIGDKSIVKYMTPVAQTLYSEGNNQYQMILDMMICFSALPSKNFTPYLEKYAPLCTEKVEGSKRKIIEEYLNNSSAAKYVVKQIMTYASYDFAQINSAQVYESSEISNQVSLDNWLEDQKTIWHNNKLVSGSDWHYEFAVQYPARFGDNIDFQFPPRGKLRFHIV